MPRVQILFNALNNPTPSGIKGLIPQPCTQASLSLLDIKTAIASRQNSLGARWFNTTQNIYSSQLKPNFYFQNNSHGNNSQTAKFFYTHLEIALVSFRPMQYTDTSPMLRVHPSGSNYSVDQVGDRNKFS